MFYQDMPICTPWGQYLSIWYPQWTIRFHIKLLLFPQKCVSEISILYIALLLYVLPTQCVINISRSLAEKGFVFPYQRSSFVSQSSQRVLFLLCEYFQQFPKNSIYWLSQVCCVWHPIQDKPTNGRYSIFKVICDFCWKVVAKQNKSIISFCC